jgi:hypothetical protein
MAAASVEATAPTEVAVPYESPVSVEAEAMASAAGADPQPSAHWKR